MTTTTETRTEGRKATAAEKRAGLLARGYTAAGKPTRCALCSGKVAVGQYIAQMPSSWRPETKLRHAHYGCFERLQEWVRARAAGESPAPIIWAPRNARPAEAPKPRSRVTGANRAAAAAYAGDGPKAAAWIAEYVAANGSGPLWTELRQAMGWSPRRVADTVIRDLARAGWLSFTAEERSLRPGPAAQSGATE
ncbi:MAG: hypothetical protein ACRDOK_27325 [Streptosporangiaceae bacterium]